MRAIVSGIVSSRSEREQFSQNCSSKSFERAASGRRKELPKKKYGNREAENGGKENVNGAG